MKTRTVQKEAVEESEVSGQRYQKHGTKNIRVFQRLNKDRIKERGKSTEKSNRSSTARKR